MRQSAFNICDLGFGAGLTLWGIRGIAAGKEGCGLYREGFDRAFHIRGALVLDLLKSFVTQVGRAGRRELYVADSACARVLPDELTLICALAAARAQDLDRCGAHLEWALGHSGTHLSKYAALSYAALLKRADIKLKIPNFESSQLHSKKHQTHVDETVSWAYMAGSLRR